MLLEVAPLIHLSKVDTNDHSNINWRTNL
jgi:hypothetical protein